MARDISCPVCWPSKKASSSDWRCWYIRLRRSYSTPERDRARHDPARDAEHQPQHAGDQPRRSPAARGWRPPCRCRRPCARPGTGSARSRPSRRRRAGTTGSPRGGRGGESRAGARRSSPPINIRAAVLFCRRPCGEPEHRGDGKDPGTDRDPPVEPGGAACARVLPLRPAAGRPGSRGARPGSRGGERRTSRTSRSGGGAHRGARARRGRLAGRTTALRHAGRPRRVRSWVRAFPFHFAREIDTPTACDRMAVMQTATIELTGDRVRAGRRGRRGAPSSGRRGSRTRRARPWRRARPCSRASRARKSRSTACRPGSAPSPAPGSRRSGARSSSAR